MLYYAARGDGYDIAALLAGDLDYLPMIQRVRLLGKRTLLVALKEIGTYYPTSKRLLETPNLFDLPHLFLEDHLEEIRLKRTAVMRRCDNCGNTERTTWTGDAFYCVALPQPAYGHAKNGPAIPAARKRRPTGRARRFIATNAEKNTGPRTTGRPLEFDSKGR